MNADTIPDGIVKKFYTEAKVSANVDVAANTAARHSHSNKTILDSIINTGSGSAFLADDGTYKDVSNTFLTLAIYDSNNNGLVDNSERLNSQLPSFYLDRSNHTGTQLASTISNFNTIAGQQVTYENLDSNGDVGTNAGQVLPGDYRFNSTEVLVETDGNTTHLGTLEEHYEHIYPHYISIGEIVINNGDGTITISQGECSIKKTNDIDSEFISVVIPEKTITVPTNTNDILYVDYNGGTPSYEIRASTAGYFYANWDTIPFATCVNIGSKIIVNDFKDAPTNGIYKNILSQINYHPIRY